MKDCSRTDGQCRFSSSLFSVPHPLPVLPLNSLVSQVLDLPGFWDIHCLCISISLCSTRILASPTFSIIMLFRLAKIYWNVSSTHCLLGLFTFCEFISSSLYNHKSVMWDAENVTCVVSFPQSTRSQSSCVRSSWGFRSQAWNDVWGWAVRALLSPSSTKDFSSSVLCCFLKGSDFSLGSLLLFWKLTFLIDV